MLAMDEQGAFQRTMLNTVDMAKKAWAQSRSMQHRPCRRQPLSEAAQGPPLRLQLQPCCNDLGSVHLSPTIHVLNLKMLYVSGFLRMQV